jgi:hypothetical protein
MVNPLFIFLLLEIANLLLVYILNFYFTIVAGINSANLNMLNLINEPFGKIVNISVLSIIRQTKKSAGTYHLILSAEDSSLVIKNHFDLYPLMTF